jgi:hypothetical protein
MALMASSQPLLPSYKAILNKYYRANITHTSKFDNISGKLLLTDYMEHSPFVKRMITVSLLRKSLLFMEPNGSLPSLKEPNIGTYSEPVKFISYSQTLFL